MKSLNPEQLEAVLHQGGPLLVLAGAGSGKTRVITHRIAELVENRGVDPQNILAVTFTNKAAKQMRERVQKLSDRASEAWISTFHAFGAKILRRHADQLGWTRGFVIYDEEDSKRLARLVLRELNLDPESHPVERMLRFVEKKKHRLEAPGEGHSGAGVSSVFYTRYQKRLQQMDAFDFADLIFQTNRLWMRFPEILGGYRRRFQHVLVDEFQDTDRAQYNLLRLLCPGAANLVVVGDDDQSIYMWRDADISHILGFQRDYPTTKVVKLERNYRSTAQILQAASAVIDHNQHRHEKRLWTAGEEGDPVQVVRLQDEREEGTFVAQEILRCAGEGQLLSDIAVLYRVNAQSRALEETFRLYGVPYVMVGGTRFFDRMEIRDLMAYLRLIKNPLSDVDLLRVINTPPRGIGAVTQERLRELATLKNQSIFEIMPEEHVMELRKPEREKVVQFHTLLVQLRQETEGLSVAETIRRLIQQTGYAQALMQAGTEISLARQENLEELVSAAIDFAESTGDDSLDSFLEHVALVTDIDLKETNAGAVNLMTLHSAKGLEFERVFLVGMEEGLLPHNRALAPTEENWSPFQGVEEERRLCYVGMTRAKKHLWLSCVENRTIFGRTEQNPPSRFLLEIPEESQSDDPLRPNLGRKAAQPQGVIIDLADIDLDDGDGLTPEKNPWVDPGDSRVIDYGDEYNQAEDRKRRPRTFVEWVGVEVTHTSFGRGRVLQTHHSREGIKLVVDFETVGRKIVLATFVRPL